MKLPCLINGQPAEIDIPDGELARVPKLALTRAEAAKALGVCPHTVWVLWSAGKIKKTSYGTYPVASLNAHLERESEAKGKR